MPNVGDQRPLAYADECLTRLFDRYLFTGALDSLVHYSILELKETHNTEQRIELVEQIGSWLERLKQVDPYRWKRYDELGKRIVTRQTFRLFQAE